MGGLFQMIISGTTVVVVVVVVAAAAGDIIWTASHLHPMNEPPLNVEKPFMQYEFKITLKNGKPLQFIKCLMLCRV